MSVCVNPCTSTKSVVGKLKCLFAITVDYPLYLSPLGMSGIVGDADLSVLRPGIISQHFLKLNSEIPNLFLAVLVFKENTMRDVEIHNCGISEF